MKHEASTSDDAENHDTEKNTENLDYKDIIIEVDEKILKFITSFSVGSFLSLEVLVDLANKFECEKCFIFLYGKSLYKEHIERDHGYKSVMNNCNEFFGETKISDKQNVLFDDENERFKCAEEIVIDVKPDDVAENEDSNFVSFREIGESEEITQNGSILPFKCSVCEKIFSKQSLLVWHSFSHPKLNQEEYSCFHCFKQYGGYGANKAKSSYKRHIERIINREKRTCDDCGHMAKTEEYLHLHTTTKHLGLKPFLCEYQGCESKFSKLDGLRRHKELHDRSNIYLCSKCNYTTDVKNYLYKHTQSHHVDKSTLNLNCNSCSYEGTSKDSLWYHQRVYHSGRINECIPCGKKYVDKEKYLLHLKRDHEGVRHKCVDCDKVFTQKHTLNTHVKRAHEGFVLGCKECDHKATSQRALREHIVRTHEDNPYACKTCSYIGTNNESLNGHMNKMHKGIRYQCDLCEHISYYPYFLKIHMREWHTEHALDIFEHQKISFDLQKYLKCEPCNKLFETEDKHKIHIKRHNNPTQKKVSAKKRPPSTCKVCGKMVGNLSRHMRTIHKIDTLK